MNLFLVILGAAIGAPARFAIDQYIKKFTSKPFGTFTVNILGSFLIGLSYGASDHDVSFFGIGFAGSFTTWSTFMLDLYLAFELKQRKDALVNVAASLTFGLLAAWFGIHLGR